MRAYIIAVLVCLSVVCVSAASPNPLTTASSPVAAIAPAAAGTTQLAVGNPVQPMPKAVAGNKTPVAKKGPVENYLAATDFIGQFSGVPLNPTAHLQRSLAEDKKYLASILRAPLDLGDPTDCKHSDIVKDEQELRKIALRINHRRVALRQQQHWIDSATDGLKKIESEIATSTETARNLAEQLDALTAQKADIVNHVRRAVILKELDSTTENLMRLKDSRLKEEVAAQARHNDRAIRNHKHNKVLKRLHKMRTRQGLALGKLKDPLPYRFAQQGMESAAQEANQQETEQTASTEQEVEQDAEQEVEQSSEQEAETEEESN